MYGQPWDALVHAAGEIGQAVIGPDIKPFEHFITIAYDNKIEEHRSNGSLNQYQNFINNLYDRGSTNFKVVFDRIQELAMDTPDLKEMTVIFFTDGEDTCNPKELLEAQLE